SRIGINAADDACGSFGDRHFRAIGVHGDRIIPGHICTIAQLPETVLAPGPKGTVRLEGCIKSGGVGRKFFPVCCGTHLARNYSICKSTVAQLAKGVIAPSPEGATSLYGSTALIATGDLCPVRSGTYLHWRRPIHFCLKI